MSFPPVWHLLGQEGYLAQSCLCTGLTALRNANLGNKTGLFYSAFFELSIGFERMMKLIYVLDYLAQHQCNAPDEKTLRSYGHKLKKLWGFSQKTAAKHGIDALDTLDADPIMVKLITFLANFAHADGRYANLNQLAAPNNRTNPLAAWAEIASTLFETHATHKEKLTADLCGSSAEAAFGNAAMNEISDLTMASLSVGDLHRRAFEIDTASRYAVWNFVRLIEGLRAVLKVVSLEAIDAAQKLDPEQSFPFMDEFFYFAWSDRSVLKKKRWP